jgi:hypothetical protein
MSYRTSICWTCQRRKNRNKENRQTQNKHKCAKLAHLLPSLIFVSFFVLVWLPLSVSWINVHLLHLFAELYHLRIDHTDLQPLLSKRDELRDGYMHLLHAETWPGMRHKCITLGREQRSKQKAQEQAAPAIAPTAQAPPAIQAAAAAAGSPSIQVAAAATPAAMTDTD